MTTLFTNYPDPTVSWEDKKDNNYGLKFAKSISDDWFNGNIISDECLYGQRRKKIRLNRLYARGEQSTDKHKKLFQRQEGDLEMVNLDWSIHNVIHKFSRVVSNGMSDEHYRIDIRTNDTLSLNLKKEERQKHIKNMLSASLLKKAYKNIGVNMLPNGFIPRDEEELDIYEQIKEKPKIEIAEEIMIDYVKKSSRWHYIEEEKNKDLTENALCAARIDTDPIEGIKIKRVNIEYLVHSAVTENDFSDAFYYGCVDTITLGDLQRESGFNDDIIRKIAPLYSKKNNHNAPYSRENTEIFLGYKIDILRFCFKTTKRTVYKKKNQKGKTTRIIKKSENFDPPKRSDFSKLEDIKDTWMEGSYVIGTDYIFNYKESENIIRDEQNKALPPFIVRSSDLYENRLHSLLDDMRPIADELQDTKLKIQHIRSEIKPDIIAIDLDHLANLSTKESKQKGWKQALSILNVKGVILTQRVDMGEMGMKEGAPVKPTNIPQGDSLIKLMNLYAFWYNQLRDVTGVNPARDGSLPADALLGVNQMNLLSSNTTTKHIMDAAIDFNKTICETISSRLHTIFRNPNANHLKKMYERAVGKQNLEALEYLKDRHLHDFGFSVEMVPTSEEIKDLKEDLNLYLQQGLISPEIKSIALRIAKTNTKLAHQYLAYNSRRRQEKMQLQQQQTMQLKSQSDIAASKQATEGRIQEEFMKNKMKLQFEAAMSNMRVAEKEAMIYIQAPEKEKEFAQEVYLEKIKSLTTFDLAEFKESAKDNRLNTQSTHQSKLINQRNLKAEPIDFENGLSFLIE